MNILKVAVIVVQPKQDNEKQQNGISIRGETIRIDFSYQGIRCRETLKLPPTKANIKYANMLRSEIMLNIQRNNFNYADYFPNSKNVVKFAKVKARKYRCAELLNKLSSDYNKMEENGSMSPSTNQGYQKLIKGLIFPYFANYFIHEVTPLIIREWIEGIGATSKTIRNALTPLRAMFDDALNVQLIDSSPLDKLAVAKLLRVNSVKSVYEVNPFTKAEIEIILYNTPPGHLHNLVKFAFYSGLRTSELMALEWSDIDLPNETISITKAKVCGIIKGTKTNAGTRTIKLQPEALEALTSQYNFIIKHVGPVFLNPNTNSPWSHNNKMGDAWRRIMANCPEVKYRNMYQTRHTYASTLLSNGENPLKVAKLMGHVNVTMIFSRYGRWIKQEND